MDAWDFDIYLDPIVASEDQPNRQLGSGVTQWHQSFSVCWVDLNFLIWVMSIVDF